jgi:hypothetical protein
MEKIEVPADILPVRSVMLLVATMPVPASPSGGQKGMAFCNEPSGSSRRAPSDVSSPAFFPAFIIAGSISVIFQLRLWGDAISENCSSIFAL